MINNYTPQPYPLWLAVAYAYFDDDEYPGVEMTTSPLVGWVREEDRLIPVAVNADEGVAEPVRERIDIDLPAGEAVGIFASPADADAATDQLKDKALHRLGMAALGWAVKHGELTAENNDEWIAAHPVIRALVHTAEGYLTPADGVNAPTGRHLWRAANDATAGAR